MRRLATALCLAASTLTVAACGSSSSHSSTATSSSTTPTAPPNATTNAAATPHQAMGYEHVPLELGPDLGAASTTGTGKVDGITCAPLEQLAYHIHAHLAVFDDAKLYSLPAGIGIPGSSPEETNEGPVASGGQCIYWLHTHTDDGVIHIESPTKRIYTLGNFFDVWNQPLSGNKVASLHGTVSAFVNGKAWTKSPRDIPLVPHADIQLEIGEPAPPLMTVDWSQTGL